METNRRRDRDQKGVGIVCAHEYIPGGSPGCLLKPPMTCCVFSRKLRLALNPIRWILERIWTSRRSVWKEVSMKSFVEGGGRRATKKFLLLGFPQPRRSSMCQLFCYTGR